MSRRAFQPANVDESEFWQKIPDQIQIAVWKVFHWERTDVMSTEEFWERVVARTLCKVISDVRNKTAAGMSFADWRAQIRNLDAFLTRVAKHASIEEARNVLHLRVKKNGEANDVNLDSRSHCRKKLILGFARKTLSFHEQVIYLGHFRTCAQCIARFQVIKQGKNEGIDPAFFLLMDALNDQNDAIQINLLVMHVVDRNIRFFRQLQFDRKNHEQPDTGKEQDQKIIQYLLRCRTLLIGNLKSLGYSIPHEEHWLIQWRREVMFRKRSFVSQQLDYLFLPIQRSRLMEYRATQPERTAEPWDEGCSMDDRKL